MSTRLNISHVSGLQLRTQTLQAVPKRDPKNGKPVFDDGKQPVMADIKEWKFEDVPVARNTDPRTHRPLENYTVFVGYKLRRVVLDGGKDGENISFLNENIRQQLKVQQQVKKDGKWSNMGPPVYVPHRQQAAVYVGGDHRAIVEEMPT